MVTDEERAELRRLADGIRPVNGMVSQTAYLAFAEAAETAVPALLDEVERLRAERDEAQANYRFMVERAADAKLDGYRELGARAAKAENERDDERAEVGRLRTWEREARAAMRRATCTCSPAAADALRAVLADAPKEKP